jgi:hypothetical protein
LTYHSITHIGDAEFAKVQAIKKELDARVEGATDGGGQIVFDACTGRGPEVVTHETTRGTE